MHNISIKNVKISIISYFTKKFDKKPLNCYNTYSNPTIMFDFGVRRITKQGGSYLISLPMQWMKDHGIALEAVRVEMDTDKTLRIAPVHETKELPACPHP